MCRRVPGLVRRDRSIRRYSAAPPSRVNMPLGKREACGDDRFRPGRVNLKERVPGRIPLAPRLSSCRRPASCLLRRSLPRPPSLLPENGRTRLAVWIDRRDPILMIIGSRGSHRLRRAADMAAGSSASVRAAIHRRADQLDVFARQDAAGPQAFDILALVDKDRVPCAELGCACGFPGTSGAYLQVTGLRLKAR
jgi:hypothetical protein